jgi:putative effector of murein hydrolase
MSVLHEFLELSAVWGVLVTVAAFGLGVWLNKKTGKAIFNPLLLGSVFVIVFISVLDIPYPDYKASAAPVSYLMLPATISLAIPLYEKWELLQKNAVAILSGILAGVLTSLGSIVAMAWILKLEKAQAVTLLPKSVTTAIGMDVAAELGGMAALCGAVIIITGIIGNVLAETICKLFRITDPMAKGIAIGTSSHAGGTAKALEMGQVEGAMGGLAIAVAGVLTAFLTPLAANLLP